MIGARPRLVRCVLGGPVAVILTLLIQMGMAFWWPKGAAQIDNIVMPVILFPLIWAGVFFYVLIEDNLPRATLVIGGLIIGHLALVILNF